MLPRTAWAEIDLDALAGNLATLRAIAGGGVPVHPVVKADAYGHGVLPVVRELAAAGADGFCVATFDEAVELRDAGIDLPILVLYPIPPLLADAARAARIAVTAGDSELLGALLAALGGESSTLPLDVHLEVETGLGRGGLQLAELVAAGRTVEQAAGASLGGLWTHLQAAEDAARTSGQLRRFEEAAGTLERAGVGLPPRHLAASGAMLVDGVASYEGVRPGLATYGIVPEELVTGPHPGAGGDRALPDGALASGVTDLAARLRPALSLHARPVRVAELPAGWGISYGPTFITARRSRIATLPLGYGDGWPRSLSNRAEALVRGRRVPLVGNVAMDAVMADVTDVPGAPITTADEFVLIGAQGAERITAVDIAKARETNSWEVLTDLSARLPRVYHAASVPRETRTLAGHHRAADASADAASGRRSMRS